MMSFLNGVALVRSYPCLAERGKIIVVGKPSRPLGDVLPYLAALPDVIAYNPQTETLTFRRRAGFLTLYPDRVFITQVRDVDEGLELLGALTEAINATWEQRHELAAVSRQRRAPRPLDIWRFLPQTNCGACGEATCMAFAVALIQSKRRPGECVALEADPALAERRELLAGLL